MLNLSSSLEDYLEAMIELYKSEGKIRITDISHKLHVEKSSVNSAIKKLQNLNLVTHEKYGDVHLTKRGEEEASKIKHMHMTLFKFLNEFLVLNPDDAETDACKIEHVISKKTFERLSKFVEYINESPFFNKEKWKISFLNYLETGVIKNEGAMH
jgi:DtxR family transcriptional regulator, Mn-dependent transcriptional regulator